VLGAMLGFYAIRTNSIFAAMLGHFLNNTIAEIWSYIARNETGAEYIQVANSELLNSILIGVICTAIVIFLLRILNKITSETAEFKPALSGTRADVRSIISHYPVIITLSIYVVIALLYILMIVFYSAGT
jgi:Methionyl-tRNA synthetase